MMWGRRRSSKSSGKAALISSVFPISWLSKLKQRNEKSCAAGSRKEKGRWNAEPTRIAEEQGSWRNGRLHGGDEEGSWGLSFNGEDSVDGRKSGCYDSGYGHDHKVFPYSCKEEVAEVAGQGEMEGLGDMVLNLRKMKEMNLFDAENLPDCDMRKDRQQRKCRAPRRDRKDGEILRKTDEKVMEDKLTDFARRFHEGKRVQTIKRSNRNPAPSSPAKSRHQGSISSGYLSLRTIEEDDGSAAEKSSSEWQSLKDKKMKELMSKSETHRKSIYVSRELPSKRTKSGKVRVYSPRTPLKVDICKIRALEDMKKAKKMKTKEVAAKERAVLDSFAVVKCSFDPQKDFRDSMLEMIMEKGLRQPEQLEELLTCYLTLNSDEYHDLIIDVFRQVWFDLNSNDLEAESPGKCNYYA